MLPSIPDSFNKIILVLGLAMSVYGYVELRNGHEKYTKAIEQAWSESDDLYTAVKKLKFETEEQTIDQKIFAARYNLPFPLLDSTTKLPKDQKTLTTIGDTLRSIVKATHRTLLQLEEATMKSEKHNRLMVQLEVDRRISKNISLILLIFGLCFTTFGLFALIYEDYQKMLILKKPFFIKDLLYKYCQSCGKMMNSARPNGTYENGEHNKAFCIGCYKNGKFTEPNLTKEEFEERCKKALQTVDGKLVKWRLKERFKRLERWRSDEYFNG